MLDLMAGKADGELADGAPAGPGAARPVGLLRRLLRGPGTVRRAQAVVLAASALVAAGMFFCLQPSYCVDSDQYLEFSKILTGAGPPGPSSYFRTPGYPALLILTGVTGGWTFYGLFAVQAVMAALVPVLVYRAMLGVGRGPAFWCGLASVASLVPYLHLKDVMTEESYLFFQFLALCSASRYLYTHKLRHLYVMAVALLVMLLTRPSGALIFLPFLLAAYLGARARWLHCLVALALIVGGLAGWSYVRSRLFAPDIPFGGLTNGGGKTAFSAVFGPSATLSSVSAGRSLGGAVQPANGPCSRKLADVLNQSLGRERAEAMLRSPQRGDYGVCWGTLDAAVGPVESDRILLHATLEALRRHPYVAAIYLRNLIEFLVGFPPASTWLLDEHSTMTLFPHVPFDYTRYGYPAGGQVPSEHMRAELAQDFLGPGPARWRQAAVDKYYGLGYTVAKGVVLLVVLLTLPSVLASRHRLFMLLCLTVIAYQALVVSLFAMAAFRYHVMIALVEVMVAIGGVWLTRAGRSPQAPGAAGPAGADPVG